MADVVFALKDIDGNYFTGFEHYNGYWDKQIRKAKFYHSEKWANNVLYDMRNRTRVANVIKVRIMEEDEAENDD